MCIGACACVCVCAVQVDVWMHVMCMLSRVLSYRLFCYIAPSRRSEENLGYVHTGFLSHKRYVEVSHVLM